MEDGTVEATNALNDMGESDEVDLLKVDVAGLIEIHLALLGYLHEVVFCPSHLVFIHIV